MKLLFLRLFMLMSSAALLASCGNSSRNQDAAGTIKTRIPAPNENGQYTLQIMDLLGIQDLYGMNGQYARFYMAPDVVDGHLSGSAPRTRFIQSGDLYIAADALSLQLATVYAHTQKLAALDTELGVGAVNKWPRSVGVAVRFTGGTQNNAFYDGDTDSMLFVPYTDNNLPLAVNAGILAHEHFHSLFYKLVTLPLNAAGKNPQKISMTVHSKEAIYKTFHLSEAKEIAEAAALSPQSAYHILFMRGLNEGLADFWGWLYTGDTDFIAYSLPDQKSMRSLKTLSPRARLMLYNSTTLQGRVDYLSLETKNLLANLVADAYTLGTQYSRILKILTETLAQARQLGAADARKQMAIFILKTLPLLETDIQNLQATDYYEPSAFLVSLLSSMKDVHSEECNVIADALNRNQAQLKYSCEQQNNIWTLQKKAVVLQEKIMPPTMPNSPGVSFQ